MDFPLPLPEPCRGVWEAEVGSTPPADEMVAVVGFDDASIWAGSKRTGKRSSSTSNSNGCLPFTAVGSNLRGKPRWAVPMLQGSRVLGLVTSDLRSGQLRRGNQGAGNGRRDLHRRHFSSPFARRRIGQKVADDREAQLTCWLHSGQAIVATCRSSTHALSCWLHGR